MKKTSQVRRTFFGADGGQEGSSSQCENWDYCDESRIEL